MSRETSDLSGKRFGRLIVLKYDHKASNGSRIWLCRCDCGSDHLASTGNLRNGSVASCGCLKSDLLQQKNYVHGLSRSRINSIWRGMKKRCLCNTSSDFERYGGRGITICDEWKNDFRSFYNWSIDNGYDENKSIDRINVNGNYEPSNCRWVDAERQANNKRNNHFVVFNGEEHTIAEWAKITGISRGKLKDRIVKLHWNAERALTTP